MNHWPKERGPARLEGIQRELTQSRRKPVAQWVLRRSTALLILAVAIAASGYLGAYAFGSVLTRSIPSLPAIP